jgi:hypothetical protein
MRRAAQVQDKRRGAVAPGGVACGECRVPHSHPRFCLAVRTRQHRQAVLGVDVNMLVVVARPTIGVETFLPVVVARLIGTQNENN